MFSSACWKISERNVDTNGENFSFFVPDNDVKERENDCLSVG